MTLGSKIRLLRNMKGLSQENMAAELHMSVAGYSKIEREETDVNFSRLEAICKALDTTLTDLLKLGESAVLIQGNNNTNGYVGHVVNHHSSEDSQQLHQALKQLESAYQSQKQELSELRQAVSRLQNMVEKMKKSKPV